MENEKLKITCLNFEGYKKENEKCELNKFKKHIIEFINNEKVDIIVGQEFPKEIKEWLNQEKDIIKINGEALGRSKFFTGFFIKNKNYNSELNSYAEIEEIWEDLFDVCSYSE